MSKPMRFASRGTLMRSPVRAVSPTSSLHLLRRQCRQSSCQPGGREAAAAERHVGPFSNDSSTGPYIPPNSGGRRFCHVTTCCQEQLGQIERSRNMIGYAVALEDVRSEVEGHMAKPLPAAG